MSATHRDSPNPKSPLGNTSPSPEPSAGSDEVSPIRSTTDPVAQALLGIQEALCRMALLRAKSLSVNAAYRQDPLPPEQASPDL